MTPEEIAINFRLLSQTLKHKEFSELLPEYQLQTIEKASRLLNSDSTPPSDRRRLANYLRTLQDFEQSESVKTAIAVNLQGWDFAPF